MGDISSETSMEDILSSIKRIIAEEGDGPGVSPRGRKAIRAGHLALPPVEDDDDDEVLELKEPVNGPAPRASNMAASAEPTRATPRADLPLTAASAGIVSERAAEASRGALDALSRMVVKPDAPGADSLEGLVREMLRPMLRDWLDANLPQVVEAMVAREIARISGRE